MSEIGTDSELDYIQRYYEEAISYQYSDPKAALVKSRLIAEIVTKTFLTEKTAHSVKDFNLAREITSLSQERVIPRTIATDLHTIRSYGNIGSHFTKERITPDYVKACLYSVSHLVQWYFSTRAPDRQPEFSVGSQKELIFISCHAHAAASSLAYEFEGTLRQRGYEVFIDQSADSGATWIKMIRQELERAQVFLLLLSPQAAASELVVEEVGIANDLAHWYHGIPLILPVRIGFSSGEALPYPLSQHLEAVPQKIWRGREDSARLLEALLTALVEKKLWTADSFPGPQRSAEQEPVPRPARDPQDLIIPGGALGSDSRFYIVRETDEDIFAAIQRQRAMVTIRGPRQTGKTSIAVRTHALINQETALHIRSVFLDFQTIPYQDMQSLDTFWRAIIVRLARRLKVKNWSVTDWDVQVDYEENVLEFLEQGVFAHGHVPILLCFDEVQKAFDTPFSSDFFGSIRAFYNMGAHDPLLKKIHWLLVTSSEPSFFIQDLNQSPFNIGQKFDLGPFGPEEVATFAQRHGLRLQQDEIDNILDYVGGHPYLVHLLLYHLAQGKVPADQLFDAATAGAGIFRDHLHRFLMQFQQEPPLADTMEQIITQTSPANMTMVMRLESAGLIKQDEQRQWTPLCALYRDFFQKELA